MKMKKVFITTLIAVMMLLTVNVKAATTGNVTIKSSKDTVKAGEEFTITISANSEEGLNGLDANMVYDKTKLEIVKDEKANENWTANISTFPAITILWNTSETSNSQDVYKVTFKVKEDITADELEIKLTGITLSTMQDNITINDKTKKITINNNPSNGDDPGNGGNIPEIVPGSKEEPVKQIQAKNDKSNTSVPYAGAKENILLFVGIATIAVFGIVSKKFYNKYRDI